MQKKNRSISKGVIEAKDKQDLYRSNQHFSPNMSKRTAGVNLNTFLNSKPTSHKDELELIQSDNFRNTNYNLSFHPNQSTNNLGNTSLGTNYQKYSKNISMNPAKSQMLNTQLSGINNSNVNNNSAYVTPFPQKNMKLESIKNINTVIKKLKSTNINSKINKTTDSVKSGINTTFQKKVPVMPSFHQGTGTNNTSNNYNNITNSSNMTSLKKEGIPSISLKSSAFSSNNNAHNIFSHGNNLAELSPTKSIPNMGNLSNLTSMSNMSNLNNINSTTHMGSNLLNHNNLHDLQVPVPNNARKEANNMNLYQQNSAHKSLFNKSQFEEINLVNSHPIIKGKNMMINSQQQIHPQDLTSKPTPDNKKHSTKETKDNSSNSSTIKNYKHSNSNSINGIQVQMNTHYHQTNIENPEDLHFFYVKMFQTNKEFAHKFEKEE